MNNFVFIENSNKKILEPKFNFHLFQKYLSIAILFIYLYIQDGSLQEKVIYDCFLKSLLNC